MVVHHAYFYILKPILFSIPSDKITRFNNKIEAIKQHKVGMILLLIQEKLGPKFVESRSVEFSKSFEESGKEKIIFYCR